MCNISIVLSYRFLHIALIEVFWSLQESQSTSGFDALKDGLPAATSNNAATQQATPEFELFENVPLPLFNINADIQKGYVLNLHV